MPLQNMQNPWMAIGAGSPLTWIRWVHGTSDLIFLTSYEQNSIFQEYVSSFILILCKSTKVLSPLNKHPNEAPLSTST